MRAIRHEVVESMASHEIGKTREESSARCHRSIRHPSIRKAIGEDAWSRLPDAVKARFADDVLCAEYQGSFDIVRASMAGRFLGHLSRIIGTPIAPYTGTNVAAVVRVFASEGGMVWERTYRFSPFRTCVVSSTKQLDEMGGFVEVLPAGLRMPLRVFERDGILHFVSRSYYFRWFGLRISIPAWLPPGETHVQHIDEGNGWFRFTMTVNHRWLGEVYFQTGRFMAASEAS
jgi:hypothetical protein